MSTTIYNGLQIDFPGNFAELRTELLRLATEDLRPAADILVAKLFANHMFDVLDQEAWANRHQSHCIPTSLNAALSDTWIHMSDRVAEVRKTQRRDPAVDFEFNLVLFPLADRMLAVHQAEHRELRDLLLQQPYIKEFAYWNNTDQPEGIDDATWAARGRTWDLAVGDNGSIPEHGFTIKLIPEGYLGMPDLETVLQHQPSLDQRVELLIEEEIFDLVLANATEEQQDALKNNSPYFARRLQKQFVESDAGNIAVTHLRQDIRDFLVSLPYAEPARLRP